MRKALVNVSGTAAAIFTEIERNKAYHVEYLPDYHGAPISLTMPKHQQQFHFNQFPAFFDGLLPEGVQLEALLRVAKLDKDDYFGQLLHVGGDLVGAVTVEEIIE